VPLIIMQISGSLAKMCRQYFNDYCLHINPRDTKILRVWSSARPPLGRSLSSHPHARDLQFPSHAHVVPPPAASAAAGRLSPAPSAARRPSSARVFSLDSPPPRGCSPPVLAPTANPSRASRVRRRVPAPPAAPL
jgi:hypothetical protein